MNRDWFKTYFGQNWTEPTTWNLYDDILSTVNTVTTSNLYVHPTWVDGDLDLGTTDRNIWINWLGGNTVSSVVASHPGTITRDAFESIAPVCELLGEDEGF